MNFKEAYKDAAKHIVQPNVDAHSVLDEARRRRARKRQLIQKGTTVASVILVLGIGGISTAKAAGYLGSMIRVGEDGFVSGDVYTMTDTVPEMKDTGYGAEKNIPEEAGVMPEECGLEPVNMMMEDVSEQYFNSVEEFLTECPDVVIALPKVCVSESGFENVQVVGESVFVRYQIEDGKSVDVYRHDYSDSLGHAASIAFPGKICNERTYTTAQGFTYTLIDEERLSEDEPMRIHGAISVEHYEIYVNFYGVDEMEALMILESVDLEIYCK